MYELNICHLYPDLLNLYGDRGNVIALNRRASWRGISVNVHAVSLSDQFDASLYDIVFLGGGQDYEQEIIQEDILTQKGNEIKDAIQGGKVFLTICGGYQILGKYYKTGEGKEIEFLGALDIWTVAGQKRMIGNFVFECDILGGEKVVGFENHSGKTYLGKEVKPLGKIISGGGNNGEDGTEGAIYKNVFCSYSHGSLLPKNPKLADHIISTALAQKYMEFTSLEKLDDTFENLAHSSRL